MMNFIALTMAIYIGLVAASITVSMIMGSKWYINKIAKMTMDMSEKINEGFAKQTDSEG